MPGSVNDPVRLDPFQNIIEVVWGGIYRVEVDIAYFDFLPTAQGSDIQDACAKHIVKAENGTFVDDPEVVTDPGEPSEKWEFDANYDGQPIRKTLIIDDLSNGADVRIDFFSRGGPQDEQGWITGFPGGGTANPPEGAYWTIAFRVVDNRNEEILLELDEEHHWITDNDNPGTLALVSGSIMIFSSTLVWALTECHFIWDIQNDPADQEQPTFEMSNPVAPVDPPS